MSWPSALGEGVEQGFNALGEGLMWGGAAGNPQVMQGMLQMMMQRRGQQDAKRRFLGDSIIQSVQAGEIPWSEAQPALQKLGYNTQGMELSFAPNQQKQAALLLSTIEQEMQNKPTGMQPSPMRDFQFVNNAPVSVNQGQQQQQVAPAPPQPAPQQVSPTGTPPAGPVTVDPVSGAQVAAVAPQPTAKERALDPRERQWHGYAQGIEEPPAQEQPTPEQQASAQAQTADAPVQDKPVIQAEEQDVEATPVDDPDSLRKEALRKEQVAKQLRVRGKSNPHVEKLAQEQMKEAKELRTSAHQKEQELLAQEKEMRLKAKADLKDKELEDFKSHEAGLNLMATKLLFRGERPAGWGKMGVEQRLIVTDKAAHMGHALGLTDEEITQLPFDSKAKQKSIDRLTDWAGSVGRLQKELEKDLDNVIAAARKLDPSQMQIANKAFIEGKRQFNDPDVAKYLVYVQTVRNKYGRVMSGPTSNAMIPVEAMKHADDLVSTGGDVASWQAVKTAMLKDSNNTMTSTTEMISSLRGSILSGGKQQPFRETKVTEPSGDEGWSAEEVK